MNEAPNLALPELTRVVLIRHGDTNDAPPAPSDPGLSELGRWQVARLRDRLAVSGELAGATKFVCSPLRRALETAQGIVDVVGRERLKLEVDRGLEEMTWGDADGLAWEELIVRYGAPSGPDWRFAPGAESWSEFIERATDALDEVAARFSGRSIVLVCHTGLVEASFVAFGGAAHRSQRFAMNPRNTSMTTWTGLEAHGPGGFQWRLDSYNDTAHLWSEGDLRHRSESYEYLLPGLDPFWAAIEDPARPDRV